MSILDFYCTIEQNYPKQNNNKHQIMIPRNFAYRMREEKNAAILKTAEISQSEERMKQQLRSESHEISELYETIQSIQVSLQTKTHEVKRLTEQRQELESKLNDFHKQIDSIDDLKNEIMDKNKVRISYLYLDLQKM